MASQPSDRARNAAAERLTPLYPNDAISETQRNIRAGKLDGHAWVQAFATFERETPSFAVGVWSSDLSAAPHACHVLAARFNDDVGDWVMGVVASPPIYPYTHWRMLDTPAPDAIAMLEATLDETKSQLDFLRIAVERDDPKAEILVRVTDVWKVADAAWTSMGWLRITFQTL